MGIVASLYGCLENYKEPTSGVCDDAVGNKVGDGEFRERLGVYGCFMETIFQVSVNTHPRLIHTRIQRLINTGVWFFVADKCRSCGAYRRCVLASNSSFPIEHPPRLKHGDKTQLNNDYTYPIYGPKSTNSLDLC